MNRVCRVYGNVSRPEALSNDLGEQWAIEGNGHSRSLRYRLHPVIEAIIALRATAPVDPRSVQRIDLRVNAYLQSIESWPTESVATLPSSVCTSARRLL